MTLLFTNLSTNQIVPVNLHLLGYRRVPKVTVTAQKSPFIGLGKRECEEVIRTRLLV